MKRFAVVAAAFLLLALDAPHRASAGEEGLQFVTTDELKSMLDRGEDLLLINALSPLEFTQTKIEGSVNLPYGKLTAGEVSLPEEKGKKLIFYCLGPKWTKSKKAAGLAAKRGHTKVFVYDEGFPEWKKRGYPYDSLNMLPNVEIPAVSAAELKAMIDAGEGIVILDLRDRQDAAAGMIAGSLNIVLEDIMARHGEIPKDRKVVIVDHAGKQTKITGRYLVKQGYTSIVRLDKGIKGGWLEAGYPVVK